MCRNLPGSTGMCRDLQGSAEMCRDLPGSAGIYRDPPGSTGISRDLPGCAGIRWDLPGSAGAASTAPPRRAGALSAAPSPLAASPSPRSVPANGLRPRSGGGAWAGPRAAALPSRLLAGQSGGAVGAAPAGALRQPRLRRRGLRGAGVPLASVFLSAVPEDRCFPLGKNVPARPGDGSVLAEGGRRHAAAPAAGRPTAASQGSAQRPRLPAVLRGTPKPSPPRPARALAALAERRSLPAAGRGALSRRCPLLPMLRGAAGGRRRGAGGHLEPGLPSGTGSPRLIAACGGPPRRRLRTPHRPSSCGIRRRCRVPPNKHKRCAAAGQAPPGAGLY